MNQDEHQFEAVVLTHVKGYPSGKLRQSESGQRRGRGRQQGRPAELYVISVLSRSALGARRSGDQP